MVRRLLMKNRKIVRIFWISWQRRKSMKIQKRTIALCIYFGLLILPIYWMLNMSLRTNADILANFALYPADLTLKNYIKIFTDPTWYMAYINALIYANADQLVMHLAKNDVWDARLVTENDGLSGQVSRLEKEHKITVHSMQTEHRELLKQQAEERTRAADEHAAALVAHERAVDSERAGVESESSAPKIRRRHLRRISGIR